MNDEWHIRIDQSYLNNAAGAGARAKADELAAGKGTAQRLLERLFDARTEDRSWRRGAEGEERVAAYLASLGERWAVVHDLTIGRKGANLDHLVIGPPGVFALNTKNLTGKLTVYEHAILQNGHKTAFAPAALREARTVQKRLSAAAGREVHAWSVLVVMGCDIEVKKALANLTLVRASSVPGWLDQLPDGALSSGEVLQLERLARTPGTWLPGAAATRSAAAGSRGPQDSIQPSVRRPRTPAPPAPPERAPTQPPPAPRPQPPGSGHTGAVTVRRWTRYGKDRLYANGPDGVRLGYLDVATGEIVLEVADTNGTISAQLRASYRALGGPPSEETTRG